MLKIYIKTALRSLQRNKLFSWLNIFGLAIGMAGALLITLLLIHMLSYDRFYKNEDQLYLICNVDKNYNGDLFAWKWTPKVLAQQLAEASPEIDDWTRVSNTSFLFTVGEKRILNDEGLFVDPDFFKMLNLPIIYGHVDNDWDNGAAVVLTRSFAESLFGTDQVVGKTLKIDTSNYVKVAAVMEDFPNNTMFNSDFLFSWEYAHHLGKIDSNWSNNSVKTLVKVSKGVDMHAFNGKIKDFYRTHFDPSFSTSIFAEPLSRNYLYDKSENGQFVGERIITVRCLAIIGGLLLLIACINFMNLSTAQSERRAREVGVKKVIGATRKRLIAQFLTESILLSVLAFLLAILLALLVLPFFEHLVGTKLNLSLNGWQWGLAVLVMLITGLIAGSYPAFYLSSFTPVKVLKGGLIRVGGKHQARSILVVLQFTVAITLILTTFMIIENTRFVQKRDAGYNQDQLVYTFINGDLRKNYEPLRNALLSSGAVTSVSRNMSPITKRFNDGDGLYWPGSTKEDEKQDFIRYSTDAGLVRTMQMHLIAGRDIDIYKYPADSNAMLLTASAVKAMRLKQPIGAVIGDYDIKWKVVGVVGDFIIEGPSNKIAPMVILGPLAWSTTIHYRLNPVHLVDDNLAKIKAVFTRFNPQYPFSYQFADDSYAAKFKEHKKFGELSLLFAVLTIFISCLGLFGLITYMAEQRRKEIGVRKVLGASVAGIIGLLAKGFVMLMVLAFVIAAPLAYIVMRRWLGGSTYHIQIQWWWFALTMLIALVIAFMTVSVQAFKAARVNPVRSLKTE